uniref:Uncharacterized protein LOC113790767 n=1 Tax=Dermatophagoides pteronyssinus TaxID=6956 RepID=A0A6P6XTV2_DERPT|nr:uncharacterized protein LOC113790767 [Dermatophagoides pteronyssinus]
MQIINRLFVIPLSLKIGLNLALITQQQSHRTMASFQSTKDKFLSMDINEKRKHYKCGDNYVRLDQIPRWSEQSKQYQTKEQTINVCSKYKPNAEMNDRLSLFNGDITTLEIDAIVNAANEQLAGGGGVDGFIHRAAGYEDLQAECRTLNGCRTGDCKMTGGYRLPAKYIIHCVGPIGEKPDLLASCYQRALDSLRDNQLRSIAFPCISTGIFGYPNENAAHIALNTIRHWFENSTTNIQSIDRIIFCLFLDKDIEIYNRLIREYFPPTQ